MIRPNKCTEVAFKNTFRSKFVVEEVFGFKKYINKDICRRVYVAFNPINNITFHNSEQKSAVVDQPEI